MFRFFLTVLMVQTMCFSAHAEHKEKVVGDWIVSTDDDDFSDSSKVALIKTGDFGFFGIRCLGDEPSLALVTGDTYEAGSFFAVKLRIDRENIVDADGGALSDKLLQINVSDPTFYDRLSSGKRLAIRIVTNNSTSDYAVPLGSLSRAYKTFSSSCFK